MSGQERRRYPRVNDAGVSLKLNAGNYDAITHTLNVSASGIYCKLDSEIPLMTRVKLMLMIPDFTKEGGKAKSLEVEGVVVRQHPVIIDGKIKSYDVAIFFDNLSLKHRDIISEYIAKKHSLHTP